MKNIENMIVTTTATAAAANKFAALAVKQVLENGKKKTKKEHKSFDKQVKDAMREYNKLIQADVFAAILADKSAPAMVTLAAVGYYSAAVGIDKDNKVKFAPAALSLSDFIEYLNDNGSAVSAPDAYAAAVKNTVDLAILKLAQGLEAENVVDLAARLEASDVVKEYAGAKCTESTPESIGYGLVESHLQAALDSLVFISREDGKNSFRVKRSDVRWLEASFGVNKTTGIMRRVIGGEAYEIEVKEKKEKKAQ